MTESFSDWASHHNCSSEKIFFSDPMTGRMYFGDEAMFMAQIRQSQAQLDIGVATYSGPSVSCSPFAETHWDTEEGKKCSTSKYSSPVVSNEPKVTGALTIETLGEMIDSLKARPGNYCYVCNKVHSDAQLKLIKYKVKLYQSLLPDNPTHDMGRFDAMNLCEALREIKSLLHKK